MHASISLKTSQQAKPLYDCGYVYASARVQHLPKIFQLRFEKKILLKLGVMNNYFEWNLDRTDFIVDMPQEGNVLDIISIHLKQKDALDLLYRLLENRISEKTEYVMK